METEDCANYFLLFGNIQGTSNVAALSDNARYLLFTSSGDNSGLLENIGSSAGERPVFTLTFGRHMFSPGGWTMGSSNNSEICDFQLARSNKTAVSKKHIEFDVEPRDHRPRVKVVSENPVQVHVEPDKRKRTRVVTLHHGDALDIIDAVTIDLGEVSLQAWRPKLTQKAEKQYRRNAERFNAEFLDAVRRLPDLESQGASTFTMRFGANNSCYKIDDSVRTQRGSFGSVYRVNEIRTRQVFAAKEPFSRRNESASMSRQLWEKIQNEFEQLRELEHVCTLAQFCSSWRLWNFINTNPANVVTVFDFIPGQLPRDPPWLIMEWVGQDLASFALNEADHPIFFSHVIDGLVFMHENNHVHRDLKPSNILLHLDQGRLITAKIADLSNSKHDRRGQMRTYTGSTIYMAPEFWHKTLSYNNKVDLWSLGIMILQCLTQWDVSTEAWDANFPPSRQEHRHWIDKIKKRRLPTAPAIYQPMLLGLLAVSASKRWAGPTTKEYLQEHVTTQVGEVKSRSLRPSVSSANDTFRDPAVVLPAASQRLSSSVIASPNRYFAS